MKKLALLFFFLISELLCSQSGWEEATKTADSLDLARQFEQALRYRDQAIELAENEPEDTQKMLRGLKMLSQAEYNFSLTRKASPETYKMMQEGAAMLVSAKADPGRVYKAYWDLNLAAFNYMGSRDDAEKYLNKSIEYHLKSPEIDTLFLLNTIHGSGYLGTLSGNFEKAIQTLEKGIELFNVYRIKDDTDLNLKGYLYTNLALIHSSQFLNIPQKQLFYSAKAEEVFASMENPDLDYFISIYDGLSLIERQLRNYRNAEGYINKGKQLYEANKERLHAEANYYWGFKKELGFYAGLIVIYRETVNKEKLLKTFSQVEAIALNNELDETEKNQYKEILRSVGLYYLNIEPNPDTAIYYLERGLNIQTTSTATYTTSDHGHLTDLAYAYFLKEDYPKALSIIENVEKSGQLMRNIKVRLSELSSRTYLALNKPDKAKAQIKKLLIAISEDNANFQFSESATADFTSGFSIADAEPLVRVAEAWDNFHNKYTEEGEKLYWMALSQFEQNLGNSPLTKGLKDSYDKILRGLMNKALEREFSQEENNRLLTFMETVEARSLMNTFLLKREIARNTDLYKLIEQEQFIRANITLLKKNYLESKGEELKQELFENELKLEKLHQQLTERHEGYKLFAQLDIATETITDKIVVKFKVIENELFKIHIENGAVTFIKIANYPELKNKINQYLTDISNIQTNVANLKKQGNSVYKKLFSHPLNMSKDPVVIIPDDILYFLPFELLVHNDRYLIENHTISYTTNFSFLNSDAINYKTTKGVAFFAPEYSGSISENQLAVRGAAYALPGAQEEVSEIAKIIYGKIYSGKKATKKAFKALESNIGILHLAMHSNLNDEDPELSNLLFSNSEEDYKMYISELYGLNFGANLAILSACNTGVGGFKDGGSLISMNHAFTIAGVPATVSSLWSAPDQSTKEIMVSFYKNLKQGKDKAKALQQAKLEYLQNTEAQEQQHPFYWAGFVLSGNISPIHFEEPPQNQTVLYVTVFIITMLVLLVLYFRKKKRLSII